MSIIKSNLFITRRQILVEKVRITLDLSTLSFLIENMLPASILVPVLILDSFFCLVYGFIISIVGP